MIQKNWLKPTKSEYSLALCWSEWQSQAYQVVIAVLLEWWLQLEVVVLWKVWSCGGNSSLPLDLSSGAGVPSPQNAQSVYRGLQAVPPPIQAKRKGKHCRKKILWFQSKMTKSIEMIDGYLGYLSIQSKVRLSIVIIISSTDPIFTWLYSIFFFFPFLVLQTLFLVSGE